MIVCGLMLSFPSPLAISGHQSVNVPHQSYQLTFTVTFSQDDFTLGTLQGYDTIQVENAAYTYELGKPMMPLKNIRVAVPADMKITNITIVDLSEQTIDGSYFVYPAQKPIPVGIVSNDLPFIQPDPQTYDSNQPYPTAVIALNGQCDLAGQVMADITVYPMRYIPAQKQLMLVTSLTFTITGVSGYVRGDYLPISMSDEDQTTYRQIVQDMVINPENVALQSSPNPHALGVGPGDYDYVIITQASWANAFQPLADWKTQKGVPATIVTTDWIYNNGGYSGNNQQKIRAFVQDVYTTWGTTYVLLGGDIDVVPCQYKQFPGVDYDPVPNDAYFADFDSDYICEVNIGRASVTGPGTGNGQIGTFINKVVDYETNPPLTNYATNAAFFGFDLDYSTPAQQCKINIKNAYIPADWTMMTVYDSQSGNHYTNVIAALNAGQNLVNHADHSGSDCMGTGYVNHGLLMYNDDMDALTNGNKQTIFYSMGCDPAAYDVDSIAEHFVRNNNGGGVGFIGNSRYGWYMYSSYDTYSMGFDVHFFKSLFQSGFYHLGAAFSNHKDSGYQEAPGDEYYQYIYTELTLLGDPELPIWTADPQSLAVTHPSQVPIGASSFTVHVTSSGSPVNQATVCLWKGTEVYLTGSTDSTGTVTFDVTPTSPGTLAITVTKHNYLPYQGSAEVTNQGPKLSIESVRGGLLGVSADIQNTGNASVSNVEWNIKVDGGFILAGATKNGTIASLAADSTRRITDMPLIGFGAVAVTVTISADGVGEITKTANGFVFAIFVKMG